MSVKFGSFETLQAQDEPPLDPLLVKRRGLVGDVMVGAYPGHSDHKATEFSILRKVRKLVCTTATSDFHRAGFVLFRSLVDRLPWEAVLKGEGVQEG